MCPADHSSFEPIAAACDGDTRVSEPLAGHTTWGIGGPADLWLCPHSIESVLDIVRLCVERGVQWTVLGAGSNVLVSDEGYRGCVINLEQMSGTGTVSGSFVELGAGLLLAELGRIAGAHGLAGPERWVGIPGTLGGAIAGNAGAFGSAVCDYVTELELGTAEGSAWVPITEIEYGYRRCLLPQQSVIVAARFSFPPGDPAAIRARHREFAAQRRSSQPTGGRSAGCIFRNPPDSSAGALIDAAGLKGLRRGGAEISRKHANFILNRGGATARDVAWLVGEMRRRVEIETGVRMETEIRCIGEKQVGCWTVGLD